MYQPKHVITGSRISPVKKKEHKAKQIRSAVTDANKKFGVIESMRHGCGENPFSFFFKKI